MTRLLLNLPAALSLLVCAAVAVMWALSVRAPCAVPFTARDTWWAIRCENGRLSVGNGPQLRRERLAWRAEADRLQKERVRLSRQYDWVATRWAQGEVVQDDPGGLDELRRLQEGLLGNAWATSAHGATPQERSALVEHSAPAGAVAAGL